MHARLLRDVLRHPPSAPSSVPAISDPACLGSGSTSPSTPPSTPPCTPPMHACTPPARRVPCPMLSAHAYRMLTGACIIGITGGSRGVIQAVLSHAAEAAGGVCTGRAPGPHAGPARRRHQDQREPSDAVLRGPPNRQVRSSPPQAVRCCVWCSAVLCCAVMSSVYCVVLCCVVLCCVVGFACYVCCAW